MSFDKLSYHKGDALSLPKGWEIKKLGDICSIQLGKTPYRKNPKFWDKEKLSGNVWLSISDLKHGKHILESAEQVSDLGAKEIVKIPKGTMLLSFKLTLGRVSFAGTDLYTNEAIAALLNLNNKISKDFLFYYFSLFDWDKAAEGDVKVKGKTLNKQKLKELLIPLPALPEQQRIVSILDKAFAAIAKAKTNAEQNLKNAKELFDSYLQGVFENRGEGWEEKKLGDACEFKGGGTPSTKRKEYWNGEIPWVSPKDMKSRFVSKSEDYVTEIAIKESSTSIIPIGSILIVVRSGILSRIVPLGLTTKEVTINQDLKALIPRKNLQSEYLFYFLEGIMGYLLSKVSRGATVHRLTTDSIREVTIPLPPLKQQQTIVRQLDALRADTQKLEAVYQQKIDDLEELKKSILQKAFAGELRGAEPAQTKTKKVLMQ